MVKLRKPGKVSGLISLLLVVWGTVCFFARAQLLIKALKARNMSIYQFWETIKNDAIWKGSFITMIVLGIVLLTLSIIRDIISTKRKDNNGIQNF